MSMLLEETVLGSLAEVVLAAASADPVARQRAGQILGLDGGSLLSPEGRLSVDRYAHAWRFVSELDADPCLGLRLAEQMPDGSGFGVVARAARYSANFGEALGYFARYSRLLSETCDVTLSFEGDCARLKDGPQDRRCLWPRQAVEFQLASYLSLGRSWTGVDWSPASVHFQHSAPIDIRRHRRFFRCPVYFRQPRNEIRLPLQVLELPLVVHRDPLLRGQARRQAEAALERRQATDTLISQTRRYIRRQAASSEPSVEDAARALGLSTRTLQRRLAELGTSYTTIVDEVRRSTALVLLRLRQYSVAEVAKRLGFSDAKAFRRAFRRWTGSSPRQYRAA